MKILSCLFILVFLNIGKSLSQDKEDLFKKFPVKSFLPIDSLVSAQIYNSWTSKKWTLSKKGLDKLKNIFRKSTALKTLILKPGHLYMTLRFKNPETFEAYSIYMYDTAIFFDSNYFSKKPSYSVELTKRINWDKLK